MYKLKYKNLIFLSNKSKFLEHNYVIFFYGLGCSSKDLRFLFSSINRNYQLLIPELPGHNNSKNNDTLLKFSRKIFLLLKNKHKITFFGHSVGGIIPILICKYFLKKKKIFFINYEGNLSEVDTKTLTKKTASYTLREFIDKKFDSLLDISKRSNNKSIISWSLSLKETSPEIFYKISCECVKYSKRSFSLSFYKTYFKKKFFLHGEHSFQEVPLSNLGAPVYNIKKTGHFSYYDDKVEFSRVFNYLLFKSIRL